MLKLDKIKKLETDRLVIRPFERKDAKDVFENWGQDKEITKYMLWKNYESITDALKAIDYYIECYNNNESFRQFAIEYKETNEVIGSISIEISKRHHHAELGYLLCKKMQNKGIMTEAIKCVVDYSLNELSCVRISADVMKSNCDSRKLLEQIGFELEGISKKKYLTRDNNFEDACIYAIVKED